MHRVARADDVHRITELMRIAIEHNMQAFLSAREIEAVRESMGVDRTLIADGTYFLVETGDGPHATLVGCGGWGKRRTLYGGDQTGGRDDTLSDPDTEAARIRAMYTHPDWIRRGVGTLILELAEQAAREAGFRRIELGSTLPGEPFYLARGYTEFGRDVHEAANGETSVVICMVKLLDTTCAGAR